MTAPAKPKHDPIVLARLTGQLGDRETISRQCAALGEVLAEFLPDVLASELGFDIAVSYAGYEVGRYGQLISDLGGAMALSDCGLRSWSDHYAVVCDSPFIITLVENMLGAVSDSIEEPEPRSLSQIELDVAAMVFDRVSGVLKIAVGDGNGYDPVIGQAYNVEGRKTPGDGSEGVFAAMVRMSVGIGPVLSSFCLIAPQSALLKSKVTSPKPSSAVKTRKEWSEQISEQVRRSKVTLQARIRLESQTLDTISRLQAGDIIPFHDASDVRVDVSANGNNLYVCEFGRSGVRYTVRVKDTHGSEDELLQHIVG